MYLKVISYIIKFSMTTIIAFVFFRSFKSKNFVLKTILKQLFNYLTFVSNCMFSNDTFDFSFIMSAKFSVKPFIQLNLKIYET